MPALSPLREALTRILRPLVRVMIARGVRHPELSDRLKELYVQTCTAHFRLGGKRLTDSRISLLTGLQRKDIRALRGRLADHSAVAGPAGAGPLPRVFACWIGSPPFADGRGKPHPRPRIAAAGPSFESLVAEVSRDIHSRTVLDEMVWLGLARHDREEDQVELLAAAYLPSGDDAALLGYFGANLGDHALVAAENLQAAPDPGRFFERAVHYNQLTPGALDELEVLARRMQQDALEALNTWALALQERDAGDEAATGRFRCGAFVYRSDKAEPEEQG
jgi:hypothetical protein